MAGRTNNKEESNSSSWVILAIISSISCFLLLLLLQWKDEQITQLTIERDALIHQLSFEYQNPEGNPDDF